MKAINIKLASFTFAAMLLASCSDSENGITTPTTPQDVVGKEVVSITDAQTLASRVYNFKVAGTSRAAEVPEASLKNVYTIEEEPKGLDYSSMKKMTDYENNNIPSNENFYIAEGETVTYKNYYLNGCTIYVRGIYEYDPGWTAGNYTVIVLPGGTLKWKSGNLFPGGGKIICYGKLECEGDLEVQNNGILKIKGDLNLGTHSLTINKAQVYIGGKLTCGNFKNQTNAFTNIQGGTEGLENTDVKIDGIVNIDGHAKFKSLEFDNSGQLYCCSLETTDDLVLKGGDGGNSALHTNYIKAKNITIHSSTKVYLVNNSTVECEGTIECKKNGAGSEFVLQGENAKALIRANKIKYNGSGSPTTLMDCYIFNSENTGGTYYIDANVFDNSATGGDNYVFSDISFVGAGKAHNFKNNTDPVTAEVAECGYTLKPKDPEPGKTIDEVGEIAYDHTHDISATCIQPYNGKLYMSYHTRGTGHGGCIEVFETDNKKQTKLLQFLQDADNVMDFNHLMIDSKSSTPNLYVVGNYAYHNDKGKQTEANGLMARIDLNSDGLLNTEVKHIGESFVNPLIMVPLDKDTQKSSLDENAIIRDGDKLLITSTRGYEVYDPNTLELLNSKPTPGKAKHIAINGNEMAALYYTSRPEGENAENAEVNGKLELFSAGANIATATPTKTIEVGGIAPNNGKNTIAIDGDNIYVCRSGNGLTCYDKNSGAEKWTWQAPLTASTKKPQGYANGVTFDNNYVYLACGGYGLVILDKNEMEEGKPKVVAKTRVTGVKDETTGKISWNSANYVTLYNGLIYVAYGKNRLKIYQLIDKNAAGSDTSYETDKKQTKK